MLIRILTAAIGIPIMLFVITSNNVSFFKALWIMISILAVGETTNIFLKLSNKKNFLFKLSTALLLTIYFLYCYCGFYSLKNPNFLHLSVHSNRGNWTWTLLFVLAIWTGDSLGYFIGSKWGKTKLAPKLSPKKSVEGAIANLMGCVVTSIIATYYLGLPINVALLVGVTIGILGQIGDLIESYIKRRAGVKDSGALLPGHGGVLDRFDAMTFAALPVLIILHLTHQL